MKHEEEKGLCYIILYIYKVERERRRQREGHDFVTKSYITKYIIL
jgi:hypothetical protein